MHNRLVGYFVATAASFLPFATGLAASNSASSPSDNAEIAEIVVTATKRSERAEDVPIAITAFSESTLQRMGADRFEDYVSSVPGLTFSSNGANSGVFAIRGVSTSTMAGNTQSPVAIYYDDLPALDNFAPLVTPDLRLFDVSSVEVLRGPQGTLFGSGAMAGAIRIITNKPDLNNFSTKTETTLESTDGGGLSAGASAAINLPLIADRLAIRLVGYYRHDGGWIDNHFTGDNDVNRQDTVGGRALVAWVPIDQLTINGFVSYQNDRPHDSAYVAYGSRDFVSNDEAPQIARDHLTTYSVSAAYSMPIATVTSISTYSTRTDFISRDFTPIVEGSFGSLGVMGPAQFADFGPSKTAVEELRLASSLEGPWHWLVGLFYLHNQRDVGESLYIPGAGALLAPLGFPSDHLFSALSDIPSTEKAVFGEVSYAFSSKWTATAGARAFHNDLEQTTSAEGIFNGGDSLVSRAKSESAITPKYALAYEAAPNVHLYGQAAKGYRVGQNNLTPPTDPTSHLPIPQSYQPDSLWNYEVGLKSTWLDRRAVLNLAVYDIEWKNIQLQATSASHYNFIDNAGQARSRGVELELRLQPVRPLELGISGAYTDATLNQVNPGVAALPGDRLPGTPRFSVSDFAQWTFFAGAPTNAFLRFEHSYQGLAYSDLDNPTALRFGNYHVFGARSGVYVGALELDLSVENVFNRYAYQNAVELPIGPSAIPLRPRTAGLTVRSNF
jgi:iron complex outermembrane receptor protein